MDELAKREENSCTVTTKNYSLCDKKIIEILNVLKVDWSVLNHKTVFITQRTSTHLMQLMCFLIPSNHFSINHQNQMQKKC